MGHWGKIWLILTLTTLGITPLPGAVLCAENTVENIIDNTVTRASTGTVFQPQTRFIPVKGQILAAETAEPGPNGDNLSFSNRRSIWGALALLSLLCITASLVVLVSDQSRARPTKSRGPEDNESEAADGFAHPPHPVSSPAPDQAATAFTDSRFQPPEPQPSSSVTPWDEAARLVPVNIVDTLVEELTSPDGAVRKKAIWELGQRGNSAAIQPLVNSMMAADSKERSLILAALAEISSRSLKPLNQALALALQDPSPEVRKNAIRDLTRIYDSAVHLSRFLAHATGDENPDVRDTAHWALGQLNHIRPSLAAGSSTQEGWLPHPPDSLPDSHSH